MSEKTPELVFHDIPHALVPEVESLLAPFLPLVRELETIQIGFDDSEAGEAHIKVLRRYHTAHLLISPSFFELRFKERETTLLHELIHVKSDIYVREVMHILKEFVPEDVQRYVYDRLEDAEEEMVDSVAHGILRLLTTPSDEVMLMRKAAKA